jgi:PilZ domain
MFERIRNLYQRLVGTEERPREEERRVWVRHSSSAQTTINALGNGVDDRVSARVRNVSRGGINLIVNRLFHEGEMLNVDLPGGSPESTSAVLGCVIRVAEHGPGEWSLGCAFADELTDSELAAFGARRQKPTRPDDNRQWVRFNGHVRASCQSVEAPASETWPAQVSNISANGIGLVVDHPVENGTLLNLNLHSPTTTSSRTILACVVHVTSTPANEWVLGCNFIRELSEDDLRALV